MSLFRLLAIIFLFWSGLAGFSLAADSNPYVVDDVAVSVTAKSPAEARNLALKTVRRDALTILFARLDIDSNMVAKITDDEVSDMVRSEQILDEKIAGGNYSATFNITFAKDFVDHILTQKKLQKSEEKLVDSDEKPLALVIPVKILQRKILLWEGSNDWRLAISKALDGDEGFKIPVSDAENIAIIAADNVNRIKYDELTPLFSKYQANIVYFLLFSQDNVSNKVAVSVRGLSAEGVSHVKLSFFNSEGLEGQELIEKVAAKVVDYLLSLKNKESTKTKTEQTLALEIPVTKLGEWLMIKNRLESSGLVTKLNIDAVSRDYVHASILVTTTDADIQELFAKNGFSLTQKTPDLYLLTLK